MAGQEVLLTVYVSIHITNIMMFAIFGNMLIQEDLYTCQPFLSQMHEIFIFRVPGFQDMFCWFPNTSSCTVVYISYMFLNYMEEKKFARCKFHKVRMLWYTSRHLCLFNIYLNVYTHIRQSHEGLQFYYWVRLDVSL